jgi:hypothetical protein
LSRFFLRPLVWPSLTLALCRKYDVNLVVTSLYEISDGSKLISFCSFL